ncbi:MAG TPA: hypothetical protein ENN27_04200 [Candidatus Atribacteria bacterium]|nr:hypothetical protein [Candidatus Atribacteria bacterium]
MTTTIEVTKTGDESNANLLRRFSRHVRGSKIIRLVKDREYSTRKKSDLKKKISTLKGIIKAREIERLKKLGKISDVFSKKS